MALSIALCTLIRPAGAATIAPLSPGERSRMTGVAWKPDCPVALDDLVSVSVTYFGFDRLPHPGTLVVNKLIASDVQSTFAELYAVRFPINKIDAWENYGPDVYADKNITVGFYCEKADDAPTEWSSHAYGMAVDINPFMNPFLDLQHHWWPKSAAKYVPRDGAPGKISPESRVFQIFTRHGWAWGGFDAGVPDYMHFYKLTVGDGAKMDRPYIVTGLQYLPKRAEKAAQP